MSTRAIVNFNYGPQVQAKIYVYCDGYPGGLGEDLFKFLDEVEKQTEDTRFSDPSYLAAKFVVWKAEQLTKDRVDYKSGSSTFGSRVNKAPLDFLSLGIIQKAAGDEEYVYKVDCAELDSNKRPTLSYAEGCDKNLTIADYQPLTKEACAERRFRKPVLGEGETPDTGMTEDEKAFL